MAPPQKRKRHADTAKEASEAPELVPKRIKAPLKTAKVLITASQESLLQLRQDFYSESEEEESEYESEDNIIDQSQNKESEKKSEKLDITFLNKYMDQEFSLPIRGELAEEEADQSDIEIELLEDFETFIYFRQLILVLKGEFRYKILAEENDIQELVSCKVIFLFINIFTNL
jgi:hypothetical protein